MVDGCKEDKTDLKVLQGLMKKRDLVALNKGDKTVIQKETWKKKDIGYKSMEEIELDLIKPVESPRRNKARIHKRDTEIEESKEELNPGESTFKHNSSLRAPHADTLDSKRVKKIKKHS